MTFNYPRGLIVKAPFCIYTHHKPCCQGTTYRENCAIHMRCLHEQYRNSHDLGEHPTIYRTHRLPTLAKEKTYIEYTCWSLHVCDNATYQIETPQQWEKIVIFSFPWCFLQRNTTTQTSPKEKWAPHTCLGPFDVFDVRLHYRLQYIQAHSARVKKTCWRAMYARLPPSGAPFFVCEWVNVTTSLLLMLIEMRWTVKLAMPRDWWSSIFIMSECKNEV